jgi:hypothetical protein
MDAWFRHVALRLETCNRYSGIALVILELMLAAGCSTAS